MDSIAQVMQSETMTTHIKSSIHDMSAPLVMCSSCGDPVQKDIDVPMLGGLRRVPIVCSCRHAVNETRRKTNEEKTLQRRLDKFRAYSLLDGRFERSTFAAWQDNQHNKDLLKIAKGYCEKWDEMYANNYGILLCGGAGTGKTFAGFAIANELYARGVSVIAVSVSKLLGAIKDSYDRNGEIGESEVLRAVSEVNLLMLDDLGVEHKTAWSYEKFYSIIDARYRTAKPLIITTNLSVSDLRRRLMLMDSRTGDMDSSERIWDRISELCGYFEVKGPSWRPNTGSRVKNNIQTLLDM